MEKTVRIAITGATYRGNQGAAAMLQSSVFQLWERYGERLQVTLMSAWPEKDRERAAWDCMEVVSAKKKAMALKVLPLAVLHRLFRWCGPIRKALEKNAVIGTYARTDLVLDEPGIAFVDTRSAAMNFYAMISNAIPLLMGVPVVKYAQALGTFHKASNRIPAKLVLPKIRLIIARGEITRKNLAEIGITKNVMVCADGAFTMDFPQEMREKVSAACAGDAFFESDRIVAVFPSAVVQAKCSGKGIDYAGVLAGFIDGLNEKGYEALILATTAIAGGSVMKNNDLIVCDEIAARCRNRDGVRYFRKEMGPEELLAWTEKCRFAVASRFHGMIFALTAKKPVMLIGWSHKYQEVLDFFELGDWATDFSALTAEGLAAQFEKLVSEEGEIRRKLDDHYEQVLESSRRNIAYTAEILDKIV